MYGSQVYTVYFSAINFKNTCCYTVCVHAITMCMVLSHILKNQTKQNYKTYLHSKTTHVRQNGVLIVLSRFTIFIYSYELMTAYKVVVRVF